MSTTFKTKLHEIEESTVILQVVLDEGRELTKGLPVTQPRRFKKDLFGNIELIKGKFLIVTVTDQVFTIKETNEDFSNLFVKTVFFDGKKLIL